MSSKYNEVLTSAEKVAYSKLVQQAMHEAGYEFEFNEETGLAKTLPKTIDETKALHKAIMLCGGFSKLPEYKDYDVWAKDASSKYYWWPTS